MNKITINASFADCIDSIIYFKNYQPLKTKNIKKNNSTDKNEIINLFKNCINYYIEDDLICFTIYKTEEEIQTNIEENEMSLDYQIHRLQKWCNKNQEWREQILNYLKHKNLNFIIDSLHTNYNK